MNEIEFPEKPNVCPFCAGEIKREWSSETGLSFFIEYECGLQLANQSALNPRVWRRVINQHCANVYQVVLGLRAQLQEMP